MRAFSRQFLAVLSCCILIASANAEVGVTLLHKEPLEQLQITYPTGSGAQKPGLVVAQSLRFNAYGRQFDINLEENRSLLDSVQRAALDSRLEIYRGKIAGAPDSWVRLVTVGNVPRGMLWDGVELWGIEVELNSATGTETPFIFRLGDLQIAPGALSCSELSIAENGSQFAKAVITEVTGNVSQAPGASSQIDFAVIGDFEFTNAKGANTDVELTTRMNNVDGIFSADLGVQLNVNRIDSYPSNDDPFGDGTESGALLDELSSHRVATATQYANGLTHLFTGRELDGSTVGVAYTGALCSRRFGTGLTQGTHSPTMDSLIAAHEIGHNFGAPHDGTTGSACESETGDFLMSPQLSGADQFSSCSIAEMQDDINVASCITSLNSTDLALVAGSQPAPILLGNTATITFDANNIGIETATNVDVDVTIPSGVTLSSISATSGTCTSGAGNASCNIGTIAAGSGVTVTVTAATSTVGNIDVVADLTATADADSGNNQATVQLSVDPAIDLILTAAATPQIVVDASTTLGVTVENRSSIIATNVSLTVTPGAGITVNSASWAPGSCNIASNVVTCQASSLAAQANDALQLNVTGTSEGNLSYSMSIDATEVDRNTANNDVSGQVNVGSVVTPPPPAEEESGGGAFGWLSLFMLLLVRLLSAGRHRRYA